MTLVDQFGKPIVSKESRISLGARGRVSVSNPGQIDFGTSQIISPDTQGNLQLTSFNFAQIRRLPLSQQISMIVKSSTELSSAVEIYQNNIAPEFEIIPEKGTPQRTIDALNFFIDERLGGQTQLLDISRQLAYYAFAEGAVAIEVSNDIDGEPSEITPVAPLSLVFEKNKDMQGEWYKIGQRPSVGAKFRMLYDYRTPNEGVSRYFRYVRTNVAGSEPYGASRVAPAIFSITSLKTLIETIVDFTKGQVFPKHIYHIDLDALQEAGYTVEEIEKAALTATQVLTGKLSAADITQDVVMNTPIVAVLVGAMDRANISGVEMIKEILENNVNRQFRIPGYLYGIARRGGGLNDRESEYSWIGFRKDLVPYRVAINYIMTYALNLIIILLGESGSIKYYLNDEDTEEYRLKGEAFKTVIEGWGAAVEYGFFSPQEARTRIMSGNYDFSEMPADLPDDAVPRSPRASRLPSQSGERDTLTRDPSAPPSTLEPHPWTPQGVNNGTH